MVCAHTRATHTHICLSVVSLGVQVVVSSGSVCVGNELPCARINTVRSLTQIRFRGTHFMSTLMALGCSWRGARRGRGRGARAQTRPSDVLEIESRSRFGLFARHTRLTCGDERVYCGETLTGHAHARTRVRTRGRDSFALWKICLCVCSLTSHQCVSTINLKRTVTFFARKRRTVYNARTTSTHVKILWVTVRGRS